MEFLGSLGGILGGLFSSSSQKKAMERQIAWQREQMQNQLQWKVADAKKANIHPVAAVTGNTFSPSSVSVGDGPDWSGIGQNIGRALAATTHGDDQDKDFQRAIQQNAVTRGELENNLLASQIKLVNQAGTPPKFRGAVGESTGVSDLANKPKDELKFFGFDIPRNPMFSDAENFEKRYGEMSDYIAGPLIAAGDAYNVLDKYYVPYAFRRAREWKGRNDARYLLGRRRFDKTDHSYW